MCINLGVLLRVVLRLNLHSIHTVFMWMEYYIGSFRRVYGNRLFATFSALLGAYILLTSDELCMLED